MKKTLITVLYAIAFSLSNVAYVVGNDFQSDEVASDAYNALQATHTMVYADLQKGVQLSFQAPLPTQKINYFGIDDIKSYRAKETKVLGHFIIEG
ncbi:MAG: hypothetical protein HN764_09975 [Gammaproteobacteria bacterium]|jgi:hypothetical protein|nr:hypothetical protein [Gammaproteobacteria bacterium]